MCDTYKKNFCADSFFCFPYTAASFIFGGEGGCRGGLSEIVGEAGIFFFFLSSRTRLALTDSSLERERDRGKALTLIARMNFNV